MASSTKNPVYTYNITKGDRFELRVTLKTSSGLAFNLTTENLTPVMQIRPADLSGSPVGTFTASVMGDSDNVVSLVLGATVSAAIPVGTYHARLLLQHATDADYNQITPERYILRFEESATRI